MSKVKRIALTSVLSGLALGAFLIENLLPPLFLPGARMGVANIFSLTALILMSPVEALCIVVVRTLLGCVIIGNPTAIIYSLSAGLVALTVSAILIYLIRAFSIVAVSVAGATLHNVVQTCVFCLVTGTPFMLTLLPYLVLLGALSGVIVGFAVYFVITKIPLRVLQLRSGGNA